MAKTKRFWSITSAAVLVALLIGFINQPRSVHAASADIIINEIMYNPASDVNNDEYLELYNTTNGSINLSGWCFTAGITGCFTSGTTLAAHSYGLVSPSASQTLATYNKTTLATYTGNLSNGGETVTLTNASSQIVNSLTYDDAPPWPTSPDGNGPSLELKDTELDNSLAASWGASITPTPGTQNSLVGAAPPVIGTVSQPTNVQASAAVTITAEVTDADSVDLSYKVMFNTDQTVTMNDDGLDHDTTAGDDIYTAQIPAQAAGQLVRFKVTATNTDGSATSPGLGDSMNYHGYVVRNPSVSSNLPIVEWFMSDADYEDMTTNHVLDDVYLNCIIAYGDQVFDNTKVRIKGEYSRTFPKNGLKFKLPSGHKISMPGYLERDVNEFHMNSEWLDQSKAMTATVWQVAKEIGIDTPSIFGSRMQRNGQYQGYYIMAEKYEKEFLQDKGYTGEMYEDTYDKVQPDDGNYLPVELFRDAFWGPRTEARRDYLFDNVDIPKITNYAAFESLINSHDVGIHNNEFQYQDTNGTGRWWLMPWDRDIVMMHTPKIVTPYVTPSYFSAIYRVPSTSLYDEPDGREMFFRRLRTLVDEYYGNDNKLLTMYQTNVALAAPEAALDIAKWGTTGAQGLSNVNQGNYEHNLKIMKKSFTVRYRLDRAVPARQVSQPALEIDQVQVDIDPTKSFIKLHNPGNTAVDISGWTLPEVNYVFPPGTVIASNSYAIVPRNDRVYRGLNPGHFVTSQLGVNVPLVGQMTLERSDSSQADSLWY